MDKGVRVQTTNIVTIDWPALRSAALQVSGCAYAPWSGLRVGAGGLTDDGQVIAACNVENASFGLTLCAECGLVSMLRAAGSTILIAVSVVSGEGKPLMPCGRCRQLLFDNGGPQLMVDCGSGSPPVRLVDLLPSAFGSDILKERR